MKARRAFRPPDGTSFYGAYARDPTGNKFWRIPRRLRAGLRRPAPP